MGSGQDSAKKQMPAGILDMGRLVRRIRVAAEAATIPAPSTARKFRLFSSISMIMRLRRRIVAVVHYKGMIFFTDGGKIRLYIFKPLEIIPATIGNLNAVIPPIHFNCFIAPLHGGSREVRRAGSPASQRPVSEHPGLA